MSETQDRAEAAGPPHAPLGPREQEEIESKTPISPPAVFEVIRRAGRREMMRPASALLAAGLVAGVALGFSLLTEALLRAHLPQADWRPLVENLGYTVGFVIVIEGRLQLFTENTITAVMPVLEARLPRAAIRLLRLWALVLTANLVGAAAFGTALWASRAYDPALWQAAEQIARHAMSFGATETLFRGVGAGWLIAALVWTMSTTEHGHLALIVIFTYVIALAGFTHVVAGTVEATAVVLAGHMGPWAALTGSVLPTLAGNILGGTVLFALLAWAQIRAELHRQRTGEG
ncbi:formate/nitrite transporter family protein [Rhodosalinus sp.]|uniref:formate/nitrite transporter family protein n=1 Tax=Rhodosalinus sp. TaxID=2047741 RepID=UPI0035624D11